MFQLFFTIQDLVEKLEFAERRVNVLHTNKSIIAYRLLGNCSAAVNEILAILDLLFDHLPIELLTVRTDFILSRAGHPELTLRLNFITEVELQESQLTLLDELCLKIQQEHQLHLQKSLEGKYLVFDRDFEYL